MQGVEDLAGTVTITTTGRGDTLHTSPGAMIELLAALHGITAPLVVTTTHRTAGSLVQVIDSAGGTTTVRVQ